MALATLTTSHLGAQPTSSWLSVSGPFGPTEIETNSVRHVGSSLIFDAIYRMQSSAGQRLTGMQRVLVTCDARAFAMVASPWNDISTALARRSTAELDEPKSQSIPISFVEAPLPFMSPSLKSFIIEGCKRKPSPFDVDLPVSLASGPSQQVHLLRLSSLKLSGPLRDVWITTKGTTSEPRMLQKESTGELVPWEINGVVQTHTVPDKDVTSRTKYRIDCKRMMLVPSTVVVYEPSGSVKSSSSIPESELHRKLVDIVPDSVGEEIARVVCRI